MLLMSLLLDRYPEIYSYDPLINRLARSYRREILRGLRRCRLQGCSSNGNIPIALRSCHLAEYVPISSHVTGWQLAGYNVHQLRFHVGIYVYLLPSVTDQVYSMKC